MTQYIGLDEYFAIAAEQLSLDTVTLLRLSRVNLADSAVNAPRAEFAGSDKPQVRAVCWNPVKVKVAGSNPVRSAPRGAPARGRFCWQEPQN